MTTQTRRRPTDFELDFRFPADVEGYSSEEECRYLFEFACGVPLRGRIVELGTYKGRSAVSLAQAHRRVYCYDRFQAEVGPWRLLPAHTAGEFSPTHVYAAAGRYGVGDYITVTQAETLHGARDWRLAGGMPIDLLFIDACHEYECVRADFEAWSRYVTPEGIIIFDDVLWPGVMQLLNELRDWAPVEGPQPGGMAAFRRIQR